MFRSLLSHHADAPRVGVLLFGQNVCFMPRKKLHSFV